MEHPQKQTQRIQISRHVIFFTYVKIMPNITLFYHAVAMRITKLTIDDFIIIIHMTFLELVNMKFSHLK